MRLVGTVRRANRPSEHGELTFDDVSDRAIEHLKLTIDQGELVLDLSRAPPGGGDSSGRDARSCSATRPTSTARSAARG